MAELGIGDDTVVVAYDDTGGLTAGRLVVMLRMLGREAALLDGGLKAWALAGFDIETGPCDPPLPAVFTPQPWPAHRLVTAAEMAAFAAAGGPVLDARTHERFTGEQALIDLGPGTCPVPAAHRGPPYWARTAGCCHHTSCAHTTHSSVQPNPPIPATPLNSPTLPLRTAVPASAPA